MRQGNNSRRGRGRSGRRPNVHPRAQTFDSNGPEGRIRGNPSQVYEKYLALARDAQASGDRIHAEALYQYAEHYFRLMNDSADPQRPRPEQRDGEQRDNNQRDYGARDDMDGRGADDDDDDQAGDEPAVEARREEAPRKDSLRKDGPRKDIPAAARSNGSAPEHGQAEHGQGGREPAEEAPAAVETEAEPVATAEDGEAAPRSRRGAGRRRRVAEAPAEPEDAGLLKILGETPRRGNGSAKTAKTAKAAKAVAEDAPTETAAGTAAETVAEAKPRTTRRRKRTTAEDEAAVADGGDSETASA